MKGIRVFILVHDTGNLVYVAPPGQTVAEVHDLYPLYESIELKPTGADNAFYLYIDVEPVIKIS